jgi:hypothetical protein
VEEILDVIKVYSTENDNILGLSSHTICFESKQSLETSISGWTTIGEGHFNQNHYSITNLFLFNGLNSSRCEITYIVSGYMTYISLDNV